MGGPDEQSRLVLQRQQDEELQQQEDSVLAPVPQHDVIEQLSLDGQDLDTAHPAANGQGQQTWLVFQHQQDEELQLQEDFVFDPVSQQDEKLQQQESFVLDPVPLPQ